MENIEMEMAGIFFVPNNGHVEWALDDVAQMKVGTMVRGVLVIRKDGEPTEYLDGQIDVEAEGLRFTEH